MAKMLLLAVFLVCVTTLMHAVAMIFVFKWLWFCSKARHLSDGAIRRALPIVAIILIMSFTSVAEASLWAAVYLWLGVIDEFGYALYFSLVTFTTLGYGDIILAAPWRILAAFQASIGIIIYGWSTAIVFAAVHRLYLTPVTDRLAGSPGT